jgi:hypothetical protein
MFGQDQVVEHGQRVPGRAGDKSPGHIEASKGAICGRILGERLREVAGDFDPGRGIDGD